MATTSPKNLHPYRFCDGPALFLGGHRGEETDPPLPDPDTGEARCRLVAQGFDRPFTSLHDLLDCARAHLVAQGYDPSRYPVYAVARYYWDQEQPTREELELIRSLFNRGREKAA